MIQAPPTAAFRPRDCSIRIMKDNGEYMDIPAGQVPAMIRAVLAAWDVPAVAHALQQGQL